MRCALFVDLPNFYSHLLESGIDDQRVLRDYFLYYCDFDRLAQHLTEEATPVWVFHSNQRFGPKSNRIQDEYLSNYINRINRLRGVTAWNVDIPNEQREPVSYHCEECNREVKGQWKSEKGIDTSLTVHLFDTMDSWDVAYLLSGDADFVPCVASLRRRGKLVTGVGFKNASSALVRECYDYVDLGAEFIREDVAAYNLFKKDDGVISHWLQAPVVHDDNYPEHGDGHQVSFSFGWKDIWVTRVASERYTIYLNTSGSSDLSTRREKIELFHASFPECCKDISREDGFEFMIKRHIWMGVERIFDRLLQSLTITETHNTPHDGNWYKVVHEYKADEDQYMVVGK